MSLADNISALAQAIGADIKALIPRSEGVVVVTHGTNGNTARPAGAKRVDWHGTAEPVNAIPPDIWVNA